MIIEYKNGGAEMCGVVFKNAEVRDAGKMKVASATVAEHEYKDADGKYHSAFVTVKGKFDTMKMIVGLRKGDIVSVKGMLSERAGSDGRVFREIEAQWVEVWGSSQALAPELRDEPIERRDDTVGMSATDEDCPF